MHHSPHSTPSARRPERPASDRNGAPLAPANQVAVVIEDDPDVSSMLCAVLERIGMRTIPVGTATAGVAAVRKHTPLLVTVDIGLPGMDGLAATKQIRAFSSCYIIMITAREGEIDVLQGLGAGADDYVVKPVRPRVLRARINALRRRPKQRAIPTRQRAGTGTEAATDV